MNSLDLSKYDAYCASYMDDDKRRKDSSNWRITQHRLQQGVCERTGGAPLPCAGPVCAPHTTAAQHPDAFCFRKFSLVCFCQKMPFKCFALDVKTIFSPNAPTMKGPYMVPCWRQTLVRGSLSWRAPIPQTLQRTGRLHCTLYFALQSCKVCGQNFYTILYYTSTYYTILYYTSTQKFMHYY